jgi:23S rRNA pseudouridine2605 synthase
LEDGIVIPRHVDVQRLAGRRQYAVEITIAEGRNHEIRRLCEALNLEVERLVRTQFGPVRLGKLDLGECRPLSRRELELIDV